MSEPTAIIGVISAATALVASVTGPLVTLYVGRSQIRAAVLSANRQRWIDAFRELIAEFCSQVAMAVQVREKIVRDGTFHLSTEPEILRQFERLVFTATKIRLMVNPLEDDHRELLAVVEGLLTTIRTAPPSADVQPGAEATGRRIIGLSHAILRREWVRVQRGA
jgi:hypothetical protein